PADLQQRYWVQPYQQDLDTLVAAGKGKEYRFSTWVTLKGISSMVAQREKPAHATRFEVLIVNLPVRLSHADVPKSQLDLDAPPWRDTVRLARKVVRWEPAPR